VGAYHYTVKAAARPPHSTGALSKLNPRVLLDAPQKHGNTLRYAREKDAALLEHFRRVGSCRMEQCPTICHHGLDDCYGANGYGDKEKRQVVDCS
jgi:hypothetical protein